METRTSANVYLVDSYVPEILGVKLPSYRQTFGHFLHLHKVEKKPIRDVSRLTIRAVSAFWSKAGIPVKAEQHSIQKLETVFYEWKGLQKHKARTTEAHKNKEHEFISRLDDLFDIAHSDALNLITIPEDRQFLLLQREKGRPGAIGTIDRVNERKMQRAVERQNAEAMRRKRSEQDIEASTSQAILESSSDDSDEEKCGSGDEFEKNIEAGAAGIGLVRKKAKINVLTPGLLAALDRTKTTSRNATYVLAETAASLGHDADTLNISRSSVQRARTKFRKCASARLRSEFGAAVPLTVHWDGKLMDDLTTKEHVDRLPVLVSGLGVEQLLGVPKLPSGTGEVQAAAVVQCLNDWDIEDRVVALCFDTTASNTGRHQGACGLIEHKLQKDLLHTACRHHIMELIIGAAFDQMLGESTGPEITLFKRFQEQWQFIERDNFQPASSDLYTEDMVSRWRNDIVQFATEQLEIQQPRDDYREFLELSLIYLGSSPSRGIHFQAPGAVHRARWMSKVLYVIKIWMFRQQFKLTKREENGIREVAVFAVLVYLKAWITASLAVEAPLNDFQLMGQLLRYTHAKISAVTSKKLGLHLWYLSEELVALALFDSRVTADTKKLMLAAMDEPAPDHPPKRPRIDTSAFLNDSGLEQFCTANSKTIFNLLQLPTSFLTTDPSDWQDNEAYQEALKTVKGLAVVNDRAERGVALIQDFNKKLTKGEEELQFLLQVVSEHRRQFPDCSKFTLLANTSSASTD